MTTSIMLHAYSGTLQRIHQSPKIGFTPENHNAASFALRDPDTYRQNADITIFNLPDDQAEILGTVFALNDAHLAQVRELVRELRREEEDAKCD